MEFLKKMGASGGTAKRFRWDRKGLPVGPQQPSGGIGKVFRWDRKGGVIKKNEVALLYHFPLLKRKLRRKRRNSRATSKMFCLGALSRPDILAFFAVFGAISRESLWMAFRRYPTRNPLSLKCARWVSMSVDDPSRKHRGFGSRPLASPDP